MPPAQPFTKGKDVNTRGDGAAAPWMLTERDKPEGGLTGETWDTALSANLPPWKSSLPTFSLGLVERQPRHLSPEIAN